MKLQRTLATLVLALPLIASAAAPHQKSVGIKHGERGVVAQLRDYLFGLASEQAAKRPAERARAAQPAPSTKSIALNGLSPEALGGGVGALSALADGPLSH